MNHNPNLITLLKNINDQIENNDYIILSVALQTGNTSIKIKLNDCKFNYSAPSPSR